MAALLAPPANPLAGRPPANGLLLPVVAVFLLVVVNRRGLLGSHANGVTANILGAVVVITAAGLGIYKLVTVFGGA